MRVRMLETRRGTEDGFVVRLFEQGENYDISEFLARRFVADGRAVALSDVFDNQQGVTSDG